MGAGQITGAHQEFIHDFAAGKPECTFKQLRPRVFGKGVMMIQPGTKRAMLLLHLQNGFRVFDSCLDL